MWSCYSLHHVATSERAGSGSEICRGSSQTTNVDYLVICGKSGLVSDKMKDVSDIEGHL